MEENNIVKPNVTTNATSEVKSTGETTKTVHAPATQTVDKQRKYQQKNNRKRFRRPKREYEEKIIDISRVTNVVKGGRRFSFSVFVVVGNKKGKVGLGHGKSAEVPDAIKKAIKDAQKNVVTVPITDNRTIPHEYQSKFRASLILIKPAPKGKGIIASGTVRAVVELAGYQDIYTKTYGSRNKANIAKVTMKALQTLRTAKQIAILRDKEISEII